MYVDESDDCTQSTKGSNSPTATSSFTEANSSVLCSLDNTKLTLLDNRHKRNSTSPCSSLLDSVSHEKDGEKTNPMRQNDQMCHVYGVGAKARIKYHNKNKVKHCSTECEVSKEQISPCLKHNESDLPSPSLLHAPKHSLQLLNTVKVVDLKKECTDNNSATLLRESQHPSHVSHAFMPEDFPLQRKRNITNEATSRTTGSECKKSSLLKDKVKFGSQSAATKRLVETLQQFRWWLFRCLNTDKYSNHCTHCGQ